MTCYNASLGCMGRQFMKRLTEELKEVLSRYCNSDFPLVFTAMILTTPYNIYSSKGILSYIVLRMDL